MCLRFWKLRAGGANKKRKIYYCRPTNPNVKVNGGAMKRFKGFNPVLFAAAVIFLCVTVYSLVSNVTVYVRQRDWPVATATVIDVAENGKEYNITYQYEARGNVYTGKLHRVRLRYGLGETLAVRYDPDAPEKSVRQGAMTRRSLLTQAGLSVVFCLVGYCLIRRALPQKEPEESSSERPAPKTPARKSRPAEGGVPTGAGRPGKAPVRGIRGAAGAVRPAGGGGLCTSPLRSLAHRLPGPEPDDSGKRPGHRGVARRPGQDHPHQRREADGLRRLGLAFPGAGGHHRRL